MYKFFFYLLALAFTGVSASPVVFDRNFFKGHPHFVAVHHASHLFKKGKETFAYRFFHLVPKLGFNFHEGFDSDHLAHHHHLQHLDFDHDLFHLLDVAGFSDCKTWYAVDMTLLDHHGHHHHHFVAFERENGTFVERKVHDLKDLGHFVHTKMDHNQFMDFVAKGVTTHPFALHVLHHHGYGHLQHFNHNAHHHHH